MSGGSGFPGIDTSVPHPARVYDYFLGGTNNFEADRIAAEAAIKAFPKTAESARAARAFLRRIVRYLAAEAGIRQFLDIGAGLPSGENVHEVARSIAPDARIVYVDNDPVVLRHATSLLAATGGTDGPGYLDADLREPAKILAEAATILDFGQPVAVLMLGILHNIGDQYDPRGIVRTLIDAIPAGSYVAIGHLTADIYPEMIEFAAALNARQLDAPLVLRDHAQVSRLFDGLELVEPGVVQLSKWRPESEDEAAAAAALWGGVARKPGEECQTPGLELSYELEEVFAVRPVTDLQRSVAPFTVVTEMTPAGDQPQAIADITGRVKAGEKDTVLLGATGTGKTASVAWIAEQVQRPLLVMLPNKTLAAQFANELREMLPRNAVEYFVSYYDYYQPEAYIPQTDTYIEKDSSLNQEVERLRHSATNSLLTRRDTVVVASVSCIYGLGTPQEYVDRMLTLKLGDTIERDQLLRRLVGMQYNRNDLAFTRGTFRVRGDTIEIIPMYEELAVRIEMFGDEIERLMTLHPLTGEVVSEDTELYIFPASHYVAGPERMERAIHGIEAELADRLAELDKQGKLLEAQRLRMRTTYDIEMMRQVGSCSGIENYSLHIDGREAGSPPNTLLDYFPEDFLLVIDESHVTVPQIGAMYEGDVSRKRVLVEHGFRLPSAIDNRPLTWEEFLDRIGQTIYLSATPGPYELQRVQGDVVEQVIRPTGLIDPEVVIKPTKGQIDDLLHEIRQRAERDERVLVTTLTKRMAEDLTDYLLENGVRARYLHSEVDTLRRVELLRELRVGEYDVLVGINLLREGLDLPEVSLVAILDADKEGFLRSATSLIQTIGRAARNVSGQVHMYADQMTPSMRKAIEETNRRREKQVAYNTANGVDPQPLRKRIADILDQIVREDADTEQLIGGAGRQQSRGKAPVPGLSSRARATAAQAAAARAGAELSEAAKGGGVARTELIGLITELTEQMHAAAAELQFEVAARIRDEIKDLKHELRGMRAAGV